MTQPIPLSTHIRGETRFGATSSVPAKSWGRYRAADAASQAKGAGYEIAPVTNSPIENITLPQGKMTAAGTEGGRVVLKTLASVRAGGKPAPNSNSHIRGETSRGVGQ